MNHSSTLFLKLALFLIGLPILLVCVLWVPGLSRLIPTEVPGRTILQIVFLVGVYGSVLIFFQALYRAFVLLGLIDRNQAFSTDSVRALKMIKRSAVVISLLYIAQMPLLVLMTDYNETPSLIVLGLTIIFASLVIAVFAAVLQRLLNDAILLKSEVDLTV